MSGSLPKIVEFVREMNVRDRPSSNVYEVQKKAECTKRHSLGALFGLHRRLCIQLRWPVRTLCTHCLHNTSNATKQFWFVSESSISFELTHRYDLISYRMHQKKKYRAMHSMHTVPGQFALPIAICLSADQSTLQITLNFNDRR